MAASGGSARCCCRAEPDSGEIFLSSPLEDSRKSEDLVVHKIATVVQTIWKHAQPFKKKLHALTNELQFEVQRARHKVHEHRKVGRTSTTKLSPDKPSGDTGAHEHEHEPHQLNDACSVLKAVAEAMLVEFYHFDRHLETQLGTLWDLWLVVAERPKHHGRRSNDAAGGRFDSRVSYIDSKPLDLEGSPGSISSEAHHPRPEDGVSGMLSILSKLCTRFLRMESKVHDGLIKLGLDETQIEEVGTLGDDGTEECFTEHLVKKGRGAGRGDVPTMILLARNCMHLRAMFHEFRGLRAKLEADAVVLRDLGGVLARNLRFYEAINLLQNDSSIDDCGPELPSCLSLPVRKTK